MQTPRHFILYRRIASSVTVVSSLSKSCVAVRYFLVGNNCHASEVVREGLRLLEQRELEDKAKLKWLHAAAKEGFDDIERGDYVTLRSDRDIEEFMRKVGEEASAELKAERSRA